MQHKKTTLQCQVCGCENKVDMALFKAKKSAGLPFECNNNLCKANLVKHGKSPRRGKTTDQKISKAQEGRMAKREGGYTQPGSGNVSGYGGDVRLDGTRLRGECKTTRAGSFTVKLEELDKLEKQARGDELPVFEFEFYRATQRRRFVILPGWVYDTLMEESGRRKS
jgi:hypothetical protein